MSERYDVSVTEEGKDGKSYFTKIGVMFPHKDGKGFSIILKALPLDGKLVAREPFRDDGGSKRGGGPDTGSKGGSFGDDDVPFLREDRG